MRVSSSEFEAKLQSLSSSYGSVCPIRADGNCFYRAYLYSIIKTSLEGGALDSLRTKFISLSVFCKSNGYDAFAVDEFHELLDEQLRILQANPTLTTLHAEIFSDPSIDGYMIAFMRCVCGAALKKWSDDYSPFLPEEYSAIEEFVRKEVDPMYRDCDQLQIVALTRVFETPVKVIYLDRSEGDKCVEHIIGEEYLEIPSCPVVTVLYRPGHYDVLQ